MYQRNLVLTIYSIYLQKFEFLVDILKEQGINISYILSPSSPSNLLLEIHITISGIKEEVCKTIQELDYLVAEVNGLAVQDIERWEFKFNFPLPQYLAIAPYIEALEKKNSPSLRIRKVVSWKSPHMICNLFIEGRRKLLDKINKWFRKDQDRNSLS